MDADEFWEAVAALDVFGPRQKTKVPKSKLPKSR